MRSGKEELDEKQMFMQRDNQVHFGSSDSSQLLERCIREGRAEGVALGCLWKDEQGRQGGRVMYP